MSYKIEKIRLNIINTIKPDNLDEPDRAIIKELQSQTDSKEFFKIYNRTNPRLSPAVKKLLGTRKICPYSDNYKMNRIKTIIAR